VAEKMATGQQSDDVTRFDPQHTRLAQLAPALRQKCVEKAPALAASVSAILDVLESRGEIDALLDYADRVLRVADADRCGRDFFAYLFTALGALMVDHQMLFNIDVRLAQTGLRFFERCKGFIPDEHYDYNMSNAHAQIYLGLKAVGQLDAALDHHRQARRHLMASIQRNPGKPEAWANLANNFNMIGRSLETIEYCNRAIALKPDHQMAYSLKAEVLIQLAFTRGQLLEAITCLDAAWAFPTRISRIAFNFGHAYEHLGDVDQALHYYQRVLEFPKDDFTLRALQCIAAIKTRKGRS
jgi:tetratricopeptide (TPR) repeat protein